MNFCIFMAGVEYFPARTVSSISFLHKGDPAAGLRGGFDGYHFPRMADNPKGHRDAAHAAILDRLEVALGGVHLDCELLPAMRALHF